MKTTKEKRDYMASYESTPAEIKKREARNKARAHAIKAGTAAVGDGTQVDHIKRLAKGGSATDANTRVVATSVNEGWRKGKKGYDNGK
jgi:hypothetical protein